MIRQHTDFPFVDARDYLHGTSILAAVADLVEAQGDGPVRLKSIKFRRSMHSNGVLVLKDGGSALDEFHDAPCTFSATVGEYKWRGAFVEDERPITRRVSGAYELGASTCDAFGGKCALRASGREEFIRAFVEANKRFHLGSLGTKSTAQVRFGYLEDWDIVPPSAMFDGTLEARNLIVHHTPLGLRTINRLTFSGEGATGGSFSICFDVEVGERRS